MKYNILILLLLMISCSDNDGDLENLDLAKILEYQPQQLKEFKEVTYKTSTNETLVFVINVLEFNRTRILDSKMYDVKEISITLNNEDLAYNLYLTTSANYSNSGEPIQFLKGGINLNGDNIMFPSFGVRDDGNPLFCRYSDNITLEQAIYENVYHNFEEETSDTQFSNIYFTPELGIIGFNDHQNKLWVLDSYN